MLSSLYPFQAPCSLPLLLFFGIWSRPPGGAVPYSIIYTRNPCYFLMTSPCLELEFGSFESPRNSIRSSRWFCACATASYRIWWDFLPISHSPIVSIFLFVGFVYANALIIWGAASAVLTDFFCWLWQWNQVSIDFLQRFSAFPRLGKFFWAKLWINLSLCE